MARKAASRKTAGSTTRRSTSTAAKASAAVEIPGFLTSLVRALSGTPGVAIEKGWGSANVALKVRGKIFAMSIGKTLVLKLPRERVDALVDAGVGTRFDPRRDGRVMKEWVVLPAVGENGVELAREAFRFVGA
jgi:hypothetical protein